MESFLFEALSKQIIATGVPAAMLLAAVYWLHKQWAKTQSEAQAAQKSLQEEARVQQKEYIDTINKERSERITLLEHKSEECEKDRTDLRRQLLDYYKSAAQVVRAAGAIQQSQGPTQSIPPLNQQQ